MIARRFLLAPLAVVAVAVWGGPAAATPFYCIEPSEPSCIDRYGTFEDDFSFQRCRRDLEDYIAEASEYADCLINGTRQEVSETQSETERAIDRFNCKARGESFCR